MIMTERLEQAITQLKTLPTNEQDAIATMILDKLEDERRWDESFARSLTCLRNWSLKPWLSIIRAKLKY
jgi:hypothetical protein